MTLEVAEGERVGLIGPNGAGKTTLFDCILGAIEPDRGRVALAGRDLTRMAVHRRARLGMGRTFQRVGLFTEMTVLSTCWSPTEAGRDPCGATCWAEAAPTRMS